jgi:8-oxo-dGTP pyrophosphatase MutT (NUDIX family)
VEVLLVTSRETQRWVIPKGWPMRQFVPYNAARREAWEEAGVEGSICRTPVGQYRYDKRTSWGVKPCLVTVYALLVQREHDDWPEQHERRRSWYLNAEAAALVQEQELQALLRGFNGTP